MIWLLIGGLAVGVLGVRLAGFLLAGAALPAGWQAAVQFVPVAVFTALAVTTLAGPTGEWAATRLVAAGAAGLVAARTRRLWACVAVGLAVYWLLRPLT